MRRTPAEKKDWRRSNERERLDGEGWSHIWVEDVGEDGRPTWTLTTSTDDHTYVRASASWPYQFGQEPNYVQVTRTLESFMRTQPAIIARGTPEKA